VTYIWRNLLQRKIRSGLSMLGVAVSVAGIVALISVAHGMRGSFDQYLEESGASLTVFSRNVADLIFSAVNGDDVEAIREIEGVEAIARTNFHMARTPRTGDDPAPIPLLICFGRYPEERLMEKYRRLLVEGRLFERRAEILASRYVAEALGWTPGTKVPLFGAEYTVVGVYSSDIAWENGGILIHADVLAQQLGRPNSYTVVFVYTAAGMQAAVKERIDEKLPHLIAVPPAELTSQFADQLEIVDEFILLITLIALVVGVLGVLNTMMMSVSERTREIGMLRALGWSRGRVLQTILGEGVLLSLIGGAIGLGLGVGGTEALMRLFPDAYLVAHYLPSTFVKGGLVALVVGVLAAFYPALRAASLRPVEALRYE
jgi:putative ABC transport system permease protein